VSVPHDLAAERSVLGSMLFSPVAVVEAGEILEPADFYRGAHRTVYEAIRRMAEAGEPINSVTLPDALEARGQLDAVGGRVAVGDIVADTPTGENCAHYARIVARHARRRRLLDAAEQLRKGALDPARDPDDVTADLADRLAATHAGASVVSGLADGALAEMERSGPYGWGAPWGVLDLCWRIVPGWVHGIIGWRSAGKSALTDAVLVGLTDEHDLRSLVWSPEGAPSRRHMLRLASIHAGRSFASPSEAVEHVDWVDRRVAWLDHDTIRTVPRILAAADAYRLTHRLDVLLIDPFTSVDKWDGDPAEPWDRMLNRHLSRFQGWARSRDVAVLVVAHPKQRDRLANGTLPVCTSNDIHGGAMWGNQLDSLVSVWRDEMGAVREREAVDVHVQKVREDGPGGEMGRCVTLVRPLSQGGRYHLEERRLGQPW
jgi:hypothetical protein